MTRSEEIRALMESEGIAYRAAISRLRRADPELRERDREYSRRWKAEHREQVQASGREYRAREDVRGKCQVCAGSMGLNRRQDGVCASCRKAAVLERRAEIQRRWAAGESIRSIAEALGSTDKHVGVEMSRIRATGHDLPYRYRHAKRERVAA